MPADPAPFARRFLGALALLSIIGFGTNLFIASEFDERHAYAQFETVFSSDPNWYLLKLTDGTMSSRRHPLVHVFMSFPARGAAWAISSLTGADDRAVRRQLVLLATPLASGIKTAVVLAFCVAIGLGLRTASLIALIDIASLSRLIFGSIPESFGTTSLAMMWMLYLAARASRAGRGGDPSLVSWFLCGLFAFGVTVTNVVPLAILLAVVTIARTGQWRQALLRSGSLAGLVILAGAALHLASQALVNPETPRGAPSASLAAGPSSQTDVLQHIRPFVRRAPLATLRHLPGGTASTFVAPPPVILPMTASPRPNHPRARLFLDTKQFTPAWLVCMAVVFGVLGVAIAALRRVMVTLQWLAMAIAGVLAFNLVLFTMWGNELFMYTLHWQPFLIAVLAIAGTASSRFVRAVIAANVLLLGLEVIWNVRFLQLAWAAL